MERAAVQQPALEEAYKADDRGRRTRAKADPILPFDKRIGTITVLIDLFSILDPFHYFTTALQAGKSMAHMVVPANYKLFHVIGSWTVTRFVPQSGLDLPAQKERIPEEQLHEGVQQIRHALYEDMIDHF
ncbi:hypothetical protein Naga_100345g3 [Nannochloropsis gaditana]|uniref:Uncharacterized protein n=1 Tax=Nannochloropsis gaditana TaxID=72520 RepID=W7T9R5_9STRA|nr:hypothetical protein Naga_100345g3 [Nannochloropsis gaditana]